MGREGQFFDFDVSYSWLKSIDNINYSYISGAREKDYTPEVLSQTTYFKRQVYTAVSTGTYSDEVMIAVSDCSTNTSASCTISGTLTSATGTDSQTVSSSSSITAIEYTLSTTCSDSLNAAIAWTPSTPNGVSMSFSNNVATISGTLSGTVTGTYNYTLTASNTAGTGSATFSGSLTVSSSTVSSSSGTSVTGVNDLKTGSDLTGQNLIGFDGSTMRCENAQVGDYATIITAKNTLFLI